MENLYTATGQGADSGQFRNDLQDMGRQPWLSRDVCYPQNKAQDVTWAMNDFMLSCKEFCSDVFACWHVGSVEEVDVILQHSEGGVDSALHYAKTISKYMKDLISYVEKRTSLGKCRKVLGIIKLFKWW